MTVYTYLNLKSVAEFVTFYASYLMFVSGIGA